MGGIIVNAVIMLIMYFEGIKFVPFVLFQITQGTVFQFWTPECLRGYGCGTPNGSLWTIGVMVQCYVILWFMYGLLHQKNKRRWMATLVIGIVFNCVVPPFVSHVVPEILYKLYMQTFFSYLWLFLIGAFLYEYWEVMKKFLVKRWYLWFLVDVLVSVTGFDVGRYGTLQGISLACFIIGFGYSFPMIRIKKDVTYGFYIYHMIVINLMIELHMIGKWYHVLIAFAVTFVFAYVSYISCGSVGRRLKEKMKRTGKLIED